MANVGSLAAGALGVVLANVVGIGELAVGGVLAYAAYRAIRYRIAPTEALIEGVELERGEIAELTRKAA